MAKQELRDAQFEVVTDTYWDRLPETFKPSPWDKLLTQVEQGNIVSTPVSSATERKSSRLSIAKRAATRGIKVEFREDEMWLVLRKVEPPKRGEPSYANGSAPSVELPEEESASDTLPEEESASAGEPAAPASRRSRSRKRTTQASGRRS